MPNNVAALSISTTVNNAAFRQGFDEMVRITKDGVGKAKAELSRFNQGRQLTESLFPIEKFKTDVARFKAMLNKSQIDLTTYKAAVAQSMGVYKGTLNGPAQKAAEEAKRLADALQKQGRALTLSINPLERFKASVADLKRLMQAGAISAQTYSAALAKAQASYKADMGVAQASGGGFGLGGFGNLAAITAITAGAAAAAQQFIKTADSMNMLKARLDNITGSAAAGAAALAGVKNIAAQTGAAIEDTAQIYQRLEIGLDRPQAEVLKLTESVTQLGVIGGSSAEAMKAGLTQFGQALSGSIVRAEEFNSLVENTPLIVKRIAEGLGVTTGQLRQLIIKGKVLSDDVAAVLLDQADKIKADFATMPVTAERGFNQVTQAVSGMVSEIDTAISGTKTLAALLVSTASMINGLTGALNNLRSEQNQRTQSAIADYQLGLAGGKRVDKGRPEQSVLYKPNFGKTGALGSTEASILGLNLVNAGGSTALSNATISKADPKIAAIQARMKASLAGISGGGAGHGGGGGRAGRAGGGGAGNQLAQQLKEQGLALTQSLKPSAEYAAQVDKLNKMMAAGAIQADVYNLALKKYQDDYGNALGLDKLMEPASKAWGETLAKSVNFEGITEGFKTQVDEINRVADEAQRKVQDGLDKSNQMILDLRSPLQILKEQIAEIDTLAALPGSAINAGNIDAVKQSAIDMFVTQDQGYQALMNGIANYGRAFEDTFINAVMGAKFSFKDLMSSILEDLARLVLRLTVINPLISGIGRALGQNQAQQATGTGGGGGFFGSLLGGIGKSLIGGGGGFKAFANGGLIPAMQPAIVGERGPELFLPGRSGAIVPNHQLGGAMAGGRGGGQTIIQNYFTVNAGGLHDEAGFAKFLSRQFPGQLGAHAKTVGQMGGGYTNTVQNRQGRRGVLER